MDCSQIYRCIAVDSRGRTMTSRLLSSRFVPSFLQRVVMRRRWSQMERRNIKYKLQLNTLELKFYKEYDKKVQADETLSIDDFHDQKTIGRGSFGEVRLGRLKDTEEAYAIKIINMMKTSKAKVDKYAMNEKRILRSIEFPFIIQATRHFYDDKNLYIVMEFCGGGELSQLYRILDKFSEKMTRFYAVQMVMSLEFLHKTGIIYRDLKLENVLLDNKGFIKLVDFGISKFMRSSNDETYTICGTTEYLAPEVFEKKGYNKSVDWWALGVILYAMVAGRLPFYSIHAENKIHKIMNEEPAYLSSCTSIFRNLVNGLMRREVCGRLGCYGRGAEEVRCHQWFADVDWLRVYQKKVMPPYVPKMENFMDTRNFEMIEGKNSQCSSSEFEDF